VRFLDKPSLKELEDFTLQSYAKLLRYLKHSHRIVRVRDVSWRSTPLLVLRHDIDFSPEAALRVAEIETRLGIRSTYFVLLSSPFYDMSEKRNVDIVRRILELGHEIGFHYSPSELRSSEMEISEALKVQIRTLEQLIGTRVFSIARHGGWVRDPFAAIKDYVNANHPYFRGDLFVHDSCRAWTTVRGLCRLLDKPPKKAQLLTHPENWQEIKMDRNTLLDTLYAAMPSDNPSLNVEEHRSTWLTDPLVIEYDRSLDGTFPNLHTVLKGSNSTIMGRLGGEYIRYRELINWYIINTSVGWEVHKLLEKTRRTLRHVNGNRQIRAREEVEAEGQSAR